MKRIFRYTLTALLLVFSVSELAAQQTEMTRKEKRQARKEARMLEKALSDSLRTLEYANEEINVGYGSIKRKNLTTSVSKVSTGNDEMASYANIGDYLMGRVPGLQVTKNGNQYTYTVRGINSINSGTDPIFIVDGQQMFSIDYLNPRDVESIEVLKDASASIYGAQGACGVILITTKR